MISQAALQRLCRTRQPIDAFPSVFDPELRRSTRNRLEADGTLDAWAGTITVDSPPLVTYTAIQDFHRTGNEQWGLDFYNEQLRQLMTAGALVFYGREDFIHPLEDILWEICQTDDWVLTCHYKHSCCIDLHAAMMGYELAMVLLGVGDRIDPPLVQRVKDEINRRCLAPYLADPSQFWWYRAKHNWNPVCNGSLGLAAMMIEPDAEKLSLILAAALLPTEDFYNGFTEDGGCVEGPGYWRYGWGYFIRWAWALKNFSSGEVNILEHRLAEKICRFPLAVAIDKGEELRFCDSSPSPIPPFLAVGINKFYAIPELLSLAGRGDGQRANLWDVLFPDSPLSAKYISPKEIFLDDMSLLKVCYNGTTLGAACNHNNVNHNHNDLGGFILHRDGTDIITDPGAPTYSRRTFDHQRYDIFYCSSEGHSVPVVNGLLQQPGWAGRGSMTYSPEDGCWMEFHRAYPDDSLKELTRELCLSSDGTMLTCLDTFIFSAKPSSLEEVFITACTVQISPDGEAAEVIPPEGGAWRITVDQPGRFELRTPDIHPDDYNPRSGPFQQIVFIPQALTDALRLRFSIALEQGHCEDT
jgi:hypothetical protein